MKPQLNAFLPSLSCLNGWLGTLAIALSMVCLSPGTSSAQADTAWSFVSAPLNGWTEQSFYFQANATDTLSDVQIVLNAQGGNNSNNWASDLLIAIVAPNGNGVEWGGDNLTSFNSGYTSLSDWPAGWNSGAESGSPWFHTADLSSGQLFGSGIWEIRVANGSDAGNANVSYALDLAFTGLTSGGAGCMDATACNYDATAFVDDGTCAYAPIGGCACQSSISLTETLAGAEFGSPLSFTGSGALSEVHIALEFQGEGSSRPADMLIQVTSPQGECTSFGGVDVTVCDNHVIGSAWPAAWDFPVTGNLAVTLDLSSAQLLGDGEWTVTLVNGNSSGAAATYSADITFYGICADGALAGCTDSTACNYQPSAEIDNGVCTWLDACGVCGGDNGTCSGCTYEFACNYDSLAIVDDGSCNLIEDLVVGCCSFTQVVNEAISGNQSTVLTLPASAIGDLGNFEISVDFQATGSLKNWASDLIISLIDPNGTCAYFGGNSKTESDDNSPYLAANNCTEIAGQGWPESWDTNVAGTYTATVNLSSAGLNGIGDWDLGLHNGDINTSPAEYNALVWSVDGLCNVEGCTDTLACNYTPNITLANDDLCVYATGCETCNPDGSVEANDDDADGICNADDLCSDTTAVNFDDAANGACLYGGCTNPCASNYNPEAAEDDGSCAPVPGCMDVAACNFDACADQNEGCTYPDACGICGGPGAIYECGCSDIPEGDCDCAGNQLDECGVCGGQGIPEGACDCAGNQPDAIGVCGGTCTCDVDENGVCDSEEILGCMSETACNYDPAATRDNGACATLDACGVCGGTGSDLDGDGICDSEEILGCTYPGACNLDTTATQDDGSCTFPDTGYDCNGECLEDEDGDGVCNDFEVRGCMEPEADNFHPAATDDDGTCYFNPCDDSCPADVNEDGIIGVQDVLMVLSLYDSACP